MNKNSHSLSLVTFVIFAFNQEKYIQEAIEGAFRQTYSPLEIILSDDHSSDGTFYIMQEMAAKYKGPHRVIVRRNSMNMMTALHVQTVSNIMSGDLMVVAAGDDISEPNRVERLVKVWYEAGKQSGVLHSGWSAFKNNDDIIDRYVAKKYHYDNILYGYSKSNWLPAAAPTVAYTTDIFKRFQPLQGGSIIEDLPLFLRAALIGNFMSTDECLVRVRKHNNNAGTGYTLKNPSSWNVFIQSKIVAFNTMQTDLSQFESHINPKLRAQIQKRIIKVLQSASSLLVPLDIKLSFLERAYLACKMVISPAVSSKIQSRIAHTLVFFGADLHSSVFKKIKYIK